MRRREAVLSEALLWRLGGADADAFSSLAIMVCTVDEQGYPHPAMLSAFELAATDPENIQLAVYNSSGTCANMRARGAATLIVVDEGLACYIRGRVTEIAGAMRSAPYNARLNMRVEQVLFDEPPPDLEPGAFITSGITCRPRRGEALERARAVLAELRMSDQPRSRS
jgi:hypothetical protein